ncbi:uncharacterized protein LOC141720002 [Apium graveolens]|uniref:uncharacterized protein LOC141720002 n=1 Tax=Apium graveolens TaxID=4045 RepID=UPI003D7B44EC
MGLNEYFTGVRGQILIMNPLPSLSQCYSILLQEENKREISNGTVSLNKDNIAMSIMQNTSGKSYQTKTSQKYVDTSVVVCEYCHMIGHVKEKCFCLHGYPPWYRLHGKPKPSPKSHKSTIATHVSEAVTNMAPSASSEDASSNSGSLNLTDGQCKQLIQMLQQSMLSTSAGSSLSNVVFNSSQFAGIATHFASPLNSNVLSLQSNWIIDSGATDHVTPYFHLLHNPSSCTSVLHLPNGNVAHVTHIGYIVLSPHITLHDVLCVPTFHYNLLSIYKLLSDSYTTVQFTATNCSLQAPTLKRDLEIGNCAEVYTYFTPAHLFHPLTPTSVLQGKTPFEMLYHKPPDYTLLIVFGCLSYTTIVPQSLKKFNLRAVKGVFLGYPYGKKGYKILNLATKHVFIARDVSFVENEFHFHTIATTPPTLLFPSQSHDFYASDPITSFQPISPSPDAFSSTPTSTPPSPTMTPSTHNDSQHSA